MAGIWSEILGVEPLGVDDDFFELGGHSLTATQIVSRASDTFLIDVPLRALFENPDVGRFAAYLEAAGREAGVEVVEIARAVLALSEMSDEQVRELLAAGPTAAGAGSPVGLESRRA